MNDERQLALTLGAVVVEAIERVAAQEIHFADSGWFSGTAIHKVVTLHDGERWQITVSRPSFDGEGSA